MNNVLSREAPFVVNGDRLRSAEVRWFAAGLALIAFACTVALIEPLSMLLRIAPRGYNEGWNAFWAATAAHGGMLYTSADSPITNNYPPLSFHLIAWFGGWLGDNVIAGRIVSLLSSVVIFVAIYVWLRATGAARRIGIAGGLFMVAAFTSFASNYVAMDDPQMLAHAFMLSGLAILWRFDFSRGALIAGAVLMLLGGFTKHLLIPLPVAVTVWLALYRRDRLTLWLACFAIGIPFGFYLVVSSYPSFLSELVSARVYSRSQALSAIRHAVLRFLPLLAIGLAPVVAWIRSRRRAALAPPIAFALMYVVIAFVVGAFAAGGEGVTRNAYFDFMIAVSLSAALGVDWLWEHRPQPRFVRLSAATGCVVLLGVGMGLYAAWLLPRMLASVRDADALEQDTRTMVQMIERLGQGHAACETLSLCYWAGSPFTLDFFNYGQKLRTGTVAVESCTAALKRGEFPVIQLEPPRKRESAGYRLWPCSPAIGQYYTEAFHSRLGALLVPRQELAKR